MVSDYERQREINIERNRALLITLGLDKPFFEPKEIKRPKAKAGAKKRKSVEEHESGAAAKSARTESQSVEAPPGGVRRSTRNAGRTVDYKGEKIASSPLPISFKSGIRGTENTGKLGSEAGSKRLHDPKVFGSIPGVEVGTWWESREGCSADAIHSPWVGGIAGGATEGAYSVALSGGYPEDVDLGYAFTYTGSGGRELKGTKANPKNLRTAEQTFDQEFVKANQALKTSSETGKPVRVIRGYKLDSPYAPYEGYRYDGLYKVEKAWREKGMQGFLVCKFAFKRLPNQPALPRRADDASETDKTQSKPTEEEEMGDAPETDEITQNKTEEDMAVA